MGSTAATSEQLDTRPLIGSFGVEITGVDVKTADRETLNEAWRPHLRITAPLCCAGSA